MVPQAQIDDEILFWLGQQEREHMLFLMLGTEDPNLKAEATRLLRAYEDATQRGDVVTLIQLTVPSQAAKRAALELGAPGWLYPSLIEHMIEEVDYVLLRVRRDLSPREVACFWTKERAGTAMLIGKMLDPKETRLTMQAMQQHAIFRDLYAACRRPSTGNISDRVLQATQLLNRFLESSELQQAKGILHPLLLQHELREGQRASASLQTLTTT